MKFQEYYKKLIDSKEFQKFTKENKKAYPCSGLFIMDRQKNQTEVTFDYYLPDTKKIFSFRINKEIDLIPLENVDPTIPEKLGMNYSFDLPTYEKMILDKIAEEKVNGTLQKILFSLQKTKGKDYLVTTCFLSNLGLLKVQIDITQNKIILFEKKSFFDMIKVIKGNKKEEKEK